MGHIVFAFAKMETFKNSVGHFEAASFADARIEERKADVVDDCEIWDKVEVLEDETDFFGAEASFAASGNTRNGFAL